MPLDAVKQIRKLRLLAKVCESCSIQYTAVLLSLLFSLVSSSLYAADRLKLATQQWPPYQTLVNGQMGGLAVDRVKCTLAKMGQPYQLHMMRWSKAQLLVETNQMDGFFAGSANAARSKYATASDPIISEELAWYLAPGTHLQLDSQEAKYQARYSAKFNTSKWLYLKKNGYNVVKKPRDVDALLQMLWERQIDVALEYQLVFEHALQKQGIAKDYFQRISVRKNNLSVHFSNDFLKLNPNFLVAFNQSLAFCLKGKK